MDVVANAAETGPDKADDNIQTAPSESRLEKDEDKSKTTEHVAKNEGEDEKGKLCQLSASELIAKGRAPVKNGFLMGSTLRITVTAPFEAGTHSRETVSKVSIVKKSKRQQKRERIQARRSAENICMAVVKFNDVNACPYAQACKFSHDLEAFLAQKPADLPGKCPFLTIGKPCPFGAACRFSGTHQISLGEDADDSHAKQSQELNILRKDFQKLLWKNSIAFPRADFQLQAMDLLSKSKRKLPNRSGSEAAIAEAENPQQFSNMEDNLFVINGDKNSAMGHGLDGYFTTEEMPIVKNDISSCSKKVKTTTLDAPCLPGCTLDTDMKRNYQTMRSNDCESCYPEDMPSGDDIKCRLPVRERKIIDFKGKLYVAPLTTVGNLPFRRVCKLLGADITCGEMAMCTNLLQGQASEWALLRRHSSEETFGVQICGAYPDTVAHTSEMIEKECCVSFIDLNIGCPIDLVVNKGAGSCLLTKPTRLQQIVKATSASIDSPLTMKVRTGYFEGKNCIHSFISDIYDWGACALTIHGRTRQQRYSKLADWNYIHESSRLASDCLQVIGNGDIFSFVDWNDHLNASKLSTCMLARGVLIKPWLLTEIKEQRHWDIAASERFDILKDYVRFGLEHWGSDAKGVETTRHFLLEWLSYMHRYIPVGLLEVIPQRLNWRPPLYHGRNELETLMASESAADWVRISEMLLGPAPEKFSFTPRHKSNAYDRPENG